MNTKILGLDLGTNSIGWAVLTGKNKKANKLVDCGVRIFQGVASKTGKEQEKMKNQQRREARGARRIIQRKAARIKKMVKLLKRKEMMPAVLIAKDPFYQIDPYKARSEGLTRKLTLNELARVFLHLSKRRGFLSNRKTEFANLLKDNKCKTEIQELIKAEEAELLKQRKTQQKESDPAKEQKNQTNDKDEKKMLVNIVSLEHKIKTTLGDYLYSIDKKRGRYTSREMYKQEFEKLWEKQKHYHQSLLNNSLKEKISNNILLQKPLKIQKFLVGKCSLEPTKKRCHKALLEFQQFRIYQDINNIEFYDLKLSKDRNLELTEKQKVFQKLQEVQTLTWSSFRKLLSLDTKTTINLERDKKTKMALTGNITTCKMQINFPKFWEALAKKEQSAFIKDCLSIINTQTLYKRLKKQYKFTPKDAFEFIKLDFARGGYANISLKAINKLLIPMRQGENYHDACQKAGYQREDQKPKNILKKLPYIPQPNEKNKNNKYQDLRNPVVIKALVELRKVVNDLLDKHGEFDCIRVELARDLKNNKAKREEITKQNKDIEKEKDDAKKDLEENLQMKEPTRENIDKYRLWVECKKMCPYTGQVISLNDLFSDQFEIEHIIPYSRSLDNSYLNKTLCLTKENRNVKKDKTPFETYTKEKLDEIRQRLSTMKKMSEYKKKKFSLNDEEVTKLLDQFTTRHLNDTRYISKFAKEYLKCLGVAVEVANGTLTANLRGILGFKKDRNDHKHHAIDAIMVGLTEVRLVQQIVNNSIDYQNNRIIGKRKGLRIPEEIKNTFSESQLVDKLAKIVVSHAKGKDEYVKGALHKETAYGKIQNPIKCKDGQYSYTHRVALEKLKESQLSTIADKYVRELVIEQIEKIAETGYKKKLQRLCYKGLHHQNGNIIRKVRVLENFTNVLPVCNSQGEVYKYYQLGSNHHLIIFENLKTKKKEAQVITTLEAATRKAKKQNIIQKEKKGCKYLLHLKINDMFYLKVKNSKGETINDYYRVQQLSKGCIIFRQHNRAETGHKGESRKSMLQTTESTLFNYSPQKLKLNSLGEAINSEV